MSAQFRYAEHRLMRDRALEDRERGMREFLSQYSNYETRNESDGRVEALRQRREDGVVRGEMFADNERVKAEKERLKNLIVAEMQSRLSAVLEKRKTAMALELIERQRICDGSEELRVLKEKLHSATVQKARAIQMMDNQEREQEDQERDMRIAQQLEAQRLAGMERDQVAEFEKAKKHAEFMRINKEQLATNAMQRQAEKDSKDARERAEVAQLVAQLGQDDEQELAARRKKQADFREEVLQFSREHQLQKESQKQQEAKEADEIEEFARQKREFQDRVAAENAQKEEEKQRILKAMLQQQEARSREAEEFERLREDLHEEELERARTEQEALKAKKKMDDRAELLRNQQEQMRFKEERRERQIDEENKLREQLMAKFAEDDRIEQMTAQKRRLKLQEHKREVDRQVQVRREMYEAEKQKELDERQRLREQEARRLRIVQEERERLLANYADPLRGFIPDKVLQREEEARHAVERSRGSTSAPPERPSPAIEELPPAGPTSRPFAPPQRVRSSQPQQPVLFGGGAGVGRALRGLEASDPPTHAWAPPTAAAAAEEARRLPPHKPEAGESQA
eukprot:gnl/TRDRNA2_/TRDRNA2_197500_c0_seq1.p1 gnl/TRDRNA2_/TRDRNA2_197500_c0~~gnl/TRDRNA2_/TRDRNA2_197500_c0_seq1.p1  ORF type:complete len:572 (+),score=186.91 gnl/TRDRNA2_/TRDRNA2_197500_c0_seq1:89-1804(+)